MRRLVNIRDNKLVVATEAIGFGKSLVISFQPLFTLTREKENITLAISSIAKGYYKMEGSLSVEQKIKFLLDCITRQDSSNSDMSKLVNAFCNDQAKDCVELFTTSGDSVDQLKNLVTEEMNSISSNLC